MNNLFICFLGVIFIMTLNNNSLLSNTNTNFKKDSTQIQESENPDFHLVPMDVASDPEEDHIIMIVDEMPKFKGGGIDKFQLYVYTKLRYPKEARENGIDGKVIVSFVINKEGKVTDVKIIRSVDPLLDNEVLRVVKSSPKWTPGKQKGEPVKVQFVLPVTFSLD